MGKYQSHGNKGEEVLIDSCLHYDNNLCKAYERSSGSIRSRGLASASASASASVSLGFHGTEGSL